MDKQWAFEKSTLALVRMGSENKKEIKHATFHIQTTFKINKLYVYRKESKAGK